MSDINIFTCVGRLAADPEHKKFESGSEIVNFRIAISEIWKSNGEKREKTLWMPVKISNKGLVPVALDYLRKGSQVGLSGKLESREYEKDGHKVTVVELNVGPFGGTLQLLGGKKDGQSSGGEKQERQQSSNQSSGGYTGGMDDDIPFEMSWR